MMKIKKYYDDDDVENVKNLVTDLNNPTDAILIQNGFDKFESMKKELISKINSEKIIGNTLSDLGNFIGQTIYKYIDDKDSSFSEKDFINGFKHGVDSMKEPSKSKWHNF